MTVLRQSTKTKRILRAFLSRSPVQSILEGLFIDPRLNFIARHLGRQIAMAAACFDSPRNRCQFHQAVD